MKYMSKIENERKTVLTQLLLVFLLTTFQSLTFKNNKEQQLTNKIKTLITLNTKCKLYR